MNGNQNFYMNAAKMNLTQNKQWNINILLKRKIKVYNGKKGTIKLLSFQTTLIKHYLLKINSMINPNTQQKLKIKYLHKKFSI